VGCHDAAAAVDVIANLLHCRLERAAIFGKIRTLNWPMCSASSRPSCTISNGMRASISAW